MGTSERKRREFERREHLFLDTAARLMREEGLVNLQMARLAEACDYATGTLYQHFVSKEDLLVALAAASSLSHTEMFDRIRRWDASTRERMFAMAVCDAEFAAAEPVHTQLVQYVFTQAVWENASELRRERLLAHCKPIEQAVSAIMREAIDNGDVPDRDLTEMELALGPWCLCEGMHSLVHTRGLLESFGISRPNSLLYRQVQTYLNGMEWQPLMDPADEQAIAALVDRIRAELILQ